MSKDGLRTDIEKIIEQIDGNELNAAADSLADLRATINALPDTTPSFKTGSRSESRTISGIESLGLRDAGQAYLEIDHLRRHLEKGDRAKSLESANTLLRSW